MNLEAINPIVYGAYLQRKAAGPRFYEPSTREQLQEIEHMVDSRLPDDFVEFMLEYSTVAPTPKNNCGWFKVDYLDGAKLQVNLSLVQWAKLIIRATEWYQNPSPYNDEIGPRLPKTLLPLSRDDNASLLIDLRPKTFGNILYHPDLSVWTFGTSMNDWDTIGYVAPNFTDMLKELNSEEVIKERYNL
ncbi:SMI1/KNR4 family protein [Bartonella sp. HY038]|uniref:SMI1/KNR4 family protein n=1 Tax=Bartonella sp. HY038 TaxID=2759660 RepID=UPI0015FC5437|nr:SMI1/KNR4 family protein [Bartonella sp. HY038]